jgi:hypothetical protein
MPSSPMENPRKSCTSPAVFEHNKNTTKNYHLQDNNNTEYNQVAAT